MASYSDALLEARGLLGAKAKLSITPQGKILVSAEDRALELELEEWQVGEYEMEEE